VKDDISRKEERGMFREIFYDLCIPCEDKRL